MDPSTSAKCSRRACVVAVLLLVAACSNARPAEVDSAAHPEFGFIGGALIGQKLDIDSIESTAGVFNVPVWRPDQRATLRITTKLGPSSCERLSATICPSLETARVRATVTALLDLTTLIPLRGAETQDVVMTGRETSTTYTLQLPPLGPGRHCLLASVIENVHDTARIGGRHHASAGAFILNVGSSTTNFCTSESSIETTKHDLPGNCGDPVISTAPDVLRLKRRIPEQRVWLFVPVCYQAASAVLIKDGVPVRSGSLGPWTVNGSGSTYARLPALTLPIGGWNLAVIQNDGQARSSISFPVEVSAG